MAVGYRGMAAFWIGGIATGAAGPVLCPCPEYGHDQTLANAEKHTETLIDGSNRGQDPIAGTYKRKGCG